MSRPRRFLIYALVAIAALILGRFVRTPSPVLLQPKEAVPDNIDFYLAAVDYRALGSDGQLRYRLQSPMLEHYQREDVSRAREPRIEYRLPGQRWQLQAQQAELQHREDRLLLENRVLLSRDGNRPIQLSTERLELQTATQQVTLPGALRLDSPALRLEAGSARLLLDQGRYRFDRVRATHQPPEAES